MCYISNMAQTYLNFQIFKVIEWFNFKLSVEIEIKQGFEKRPRAVLHWDYLENST